jgi:hypothetical protein
MSKHQIAHYVAKSNFGGYYNGMGNFTDQIRQAKMYNSVKAAIDNVTNAIQKINKGKPDEHKITSFELVEVVIVEKGIVDTINIQI